MSILRKTIKMHFIDYLLISLILLSLVSGGFSILRLTTPRYKVAVEKIAYQGQVLDDFKREYDTLTASPLLQPTYWFSALLFACFIFYKKPRVQLHLVKWWIIRFGIFIAYMILSTFWAMDPAFSRMTTPQLTNIFFIIVVSYTIFGSLTNMKINVFFKLLFLVSLIYIAWSLPEFTVRARITTPYGGPNVFVRYMSTGFLISIYFWLAHRNKIWLAFIPLFLIFALLTGSRGGIAALAISFTSLILFIIIPKKRFISFFVSVFLIIVLYCNLPLSGITIYQKAEKTWNERFVKLTFEQKYISGRDRLYQEAWNTFLEYPIRGIGLSNVYTKLGGYSHNIILDIAAEGGVLGLFLFSYTLAILFIGTHRVRSLEGRFSLVLGIYYFFASMFSGSYYDTRFMWIFFLFYLLTLAQETSDRAAVNTEWGQIAKQ